MTRFKSAVKKLLSAAAIPVLVLIYPTVRSQDRGDDVSRHSGQRTSARPVTIPVTIKAKPAKEIQIVDLAGLVREDGETQDVISIRRPAEAPLTLALLLQDNLVPSIGTEAKTIANFVRQRPPGSRVMIGYIRAGTIEVRRKFTDDLNKAAEAVRPPVGLASAAPYNPYVEIVEALRRFDSQPAGRRALVVVSDGLDISRGVDSSSASQSLDLQRAITEAQRRGIAVYSIYVPAAGPTADNQLLVANAQSSLQRLSSETGGRAYFQGTGAPVSFDPFLREIDASLSQQIALTYLSTHTGKGFHRIDIKSQERNVEIRHPAGYTR